MASDGIRDYGSQPTQPIRIETGKYLVGAQVCNLWNSSSAWEKIKPFANRKPVLGWYDEADPRIMDWEIKFALEHGIHFFMNCWYRSKNNLGKRPITAEYDHWLRGLEHSRYGDQMKFMIMWENANDIASGVDSESDLIENLLPYWMEKYFSKSNYLVLDGNPVLSIYNIGLLVEQLGGSLPAARAIENMRKRCIEAGFKGLILFGQYCWGPVTERNQLMKDIGLDYSFSYHWPTFADGSTNPGAEFFGDNPDSIILAQKKCWEEQSLGAVPNIVTCSMGWDSEPWGYSCTDQTWRLEPRDFQRLCETARQELDTRHGGGLESTIILLDNWNEYGEGHYIFPTEKYGSSYLEAVREAFRTV